MPQESLHYYTLNLQQQTPISIKWGDWEDMPSTPISPAAPEVYLVTPTVSYGRIVRQVITKERFN